MVAGMVLAGGGAGVDWVKKCDAKAGARPPAAFINRENLRVCFAALLNIGVILKAGIGMSAVKKRDKVSATCGIKRLGSGCKKRELLKVRASVGLVHRAFW